MCTLMVNFCICSRAEKKIHIEEKMSRLFSFYGNFKSLTTSLLPIFFWKSVGEKTTREHGNKNKKFEHLPEINF